MMKTKMVQSVLLLIGLMVGSICGVAEDLTAPQRHQEKMLRTAIAISTDETIKIRMFGTKLWILGKMGQVDSNSVEVRLIDGTTRNIPFKEMDRLEMYGRPTRWTRTFAVIGGAGLTVLVVATLTFGG
jgi:hypothetical protein